MNHNSRYSTVARSLTLAVLAPPASLARLIPHPPNITSIAVLTLFGALTQVERRFTSLRERPSLSLS